MGDGPVDDVAAAMQQVSDSLPAARRGCLWIAEAYLFRDALTQAATALSLTTGVRVATGVANVYTRHPALLAMAAATLEEQFPGRFVLGVGSGDRSWMRQLALASPHPLRDLEQTLRFLAALRETGRGTLELAGRRTDELRMVPALRLPVPTVVGTTGPKTIAMAGRESDGVLLSFYDGDAERLAEQVACFGGDRDGRAGGLGCVVQCFVVGSWLPAEARAGVERLCARLGAMGPPERAPRAFAVERESVGELLAGIETAGAREVAFVAPRGTERQLAELLAAALRIERKGGTK